MTPIWRRSVRIDSEGIPWSQSGVRADFVYRLFMAGYSVEEIRTTYVDGLDLPVQNIEDCIRHGIRKVKP